MRPHHVRSRPRRRRAVGQSAIEFALIAPIFFGALFGTFDGGLLMFSASATNHSAGIGMIYVAQAGNDPAADTAAIAAIKASGFAASGFAKVDEIDIFMTHTDSRGVVTQDTNSCPGSKPCVDRYDINGAVIGGGVPPWDPATRQTALSSLSSVGITIKAHYNYLAFNSSQVSLDFTRYFQLEPQS